MASHLRKLVEIFFFKVDNMAISETQMYTRYSEWKILLQNHRHRNVFGELNDITFLALLWQHHPPIYLFVTFLLKNWKNGVNNTAWKVSKCRVISGPYFPVFGLNTRKYGPEITPYLDTFHAVQMGSNQCLHW